MDLSISFASLVKTNNGFFKSDKQASFLLSQCRDGEYSTSGHLHGNSYQLFYTCDDAGVTKVEKSTHAKGLVLQWERVEEGKTSIQTSKEFKRLTRLINGYVKSIASRQASMDAGTYDAPQTIFDSCMQAEQDQIVRLKEMIAQIK